MEVLICKVNGCEIKRENEEFKKQNEELKWEQKQILEDNENYQKENEELKAQLKRLKLLEDRIHNLRIKNASLENKVEKMKCCENCKHYNQTDKVFGYPCEMELFYKDNCIKWELAE